MFWLAHRVCVRWVGLVGAAIPLPTGLIACGSDSTCQVGCVESVSFKFSRPFSGLMVRIALAPQAEVVCTRSENDVLYTCTGAQGLRLDSDERATIHALTTSKGVRLGSNELVVDVDGARHIDFEFTYAPQRMEGPCGGECNAPATFTVD